MIALRHLKRPAEKSICLRRFYTAQSIKVEKKSYLPTFEQTSSPELDGVLSTIRNHILLIKQLNKDQLNLIKDPKQKEYLENENVVITIGETDVRLQPYKPVSVPESYRKALELTKQSGEWNVMSRLIGASKTADVALRKKFLEKFARNCLEAKRVSALCRLAFAKWSPYDLQDVRFRSPLVTAIRDEAKDSEWDHQTLLRSTRYIEYMQRLLRTEVGKVHSDPLISLVIIELYSQLANKKYNTQVDDISDQKDLLSIAVKPRDFKEELAKYVERFKNSTSELIWMPEFKVPVNGQNHISGAEASRISSMLQIISKFSEKYPFLCSPAIVDELRARLHVIVKEAVEVHKLPTLVQDKVTKAGSAVGITL